MRSEVIVLTKGDGRCDGASNRMWPDKRHAYRILSTYFKDEYERTEKYGTLFCQSCGQVIEVLAAIALPEGSA